MKQFTKVLRRCLVCALVILPMIAGAFLIDFAKAKDNGLLSKTSLLASDPWGGRGSNTIDGTGFDDPGTAGSTTTEPTGTAATRTWTEELELYYINSQFNTLFNESYAKGNFRKNSAGEFLYNVPGNEDIGQKATNPWIISTRAEFVFWARCIQAAYSNSSYMAAAYFARPYFKLGDNIDLEGFRWEAPRFYSPTTNKYTITTTTANTANGVDGGEYLNRIYFDGGDFTISNVYVSQTEVTGSYTASPSIFGGIPMKSIIHNVKIDGAFITAPDSVSTNEVSIVAQTGGAECVFDNIHVTNSVIRGNRSMNGIAANASVIMNCSVANTSFVSVPTAGGCELRGIGLAAEFNGNSVINTNLEVTNSSFYTWSEGIGKVRLVPASHATNGSGYDRDVVINGEAKLGWKTEQQVDGTSGVQFVGGYFNNTVINTKIGSNGGTSYGHAAGIGLVNVAAPVSFIGNTVKNSIVGVRTDNDVSSTSLYACGIAYISNAEYDVKIADNAVVSSTVTVSTKQHTPYAFGMFYITADRGAVIKDCYTENTDVIARVNGTTGSAYAYTAGICGGFAISFTNCVVGSGNIEARAVAGYIFAYGVGTTFGISSTTGPYYRKNWSNDAANAGTNNDDNGWWDFTSNDEKGEDYRFTALTTFENCYNFSNITTSSTGHIFAAGIGMGEGFTNCVNYGNIMGNQIGGIAYGFTSDGDGSPGTAAGNRVTKTGALHPLIIKNCANYGNLIRAANNQTSYVGGIFARYEAYRNYRKERLVANGIIQVIENIDGKYLEVTDCISGGRIYFYVLQAGSEHVYELTDDYERIPLNSNYWGVIFGSLNLQAYMFQNNTTEQSVKTDTFDDFINNRFIMQNNNYFEHIPFDFMGTERILASNKFPVGDPVKPNTSGHDFVVNTPTTYWRQTVYGPSYSTINIRPEEDTSNILDGETSALSVWSAIMSRWDSDCLQPYLDFDDISSTVWNTQSGVPQVVYDDYSSADDFPFHILAYDRNTARQGYAPNVSIKKYDDATGFTLGEFQNAEVGVKIEFWEDRATSPATPYEVGVDVVPNVRNAVDAPRAGVLPITMLFADNQDIHYSISHGKGQTIGSQAGEYTYTGSTAPVVKHDPDLGESRNDHLEINVSYRSENPVVSGVVWEAEVADNVWREIVTYEITGTETTYTSTLSRPVTEGFILAYAKGDSFEIRARFIEENIYTITVNINEIIDPSATLSVNLTSCEHGDELKFAENSIITLTASYDTELYNFVEFLIDEDAYTVDAGSIYSPSVAIVVTDDIENLSFKLSKREYNVVIQTQVLASGGLRVNLENEELIVTDSAALAGKAYVGGTINGLEVTDFYEDVDAKCFYKFVRWEFISGGEIPGTVLANPDEGIINPKSGFILFDYPLLKNNNLRDTYSGRAFVVVAVFQRQVKLEIDMKEDIENIQGFDNNSYSVYLEDGNEPMQIRDFGDFTGVIVDENSLIRVEFAPDTRLEVTAIDGVSIDDRRDKNVLYLALKEFRHLEVTLKARPAKILVRYNRAHDDAGISYSGGLGIVDVDVHETEIGVSFQDNFEIDFNHLVNSHLYRIIDLQIKNVLEGGTVFESFKTLKGLNLKQSSTINMTADEEFFQNYVSIDGTCEIWLRVAAIYEVNVSVQNFARQSGTTRFSDDFSNNFEITFLKNDTPVAIGNALNETGVKEIGAGNFIVDHGIQIKYNYSPEFSKFYELNLSENEQEEKAITVTSTRQIAVSPIMFTLNITQNGKSKATIDSYTKTFGIGSTITIACTVEDSFQINGITFGNGTSLASLGAVRKGNTVTILATPDFIEAVNSGLNSNVALTMSFTTGLSNTILFGGFGGGALLLLLVALTVLLIIRSKNITKKRLAAEAKVREYEQKFNIGGMISKLREDPMAYESSMKQAGKNAVKAASNAEVKPASVAPAPAPVAEISLSGCSILPDRTVVDKNKKKIATMQKDGLIVDANGKQIAKVSLDSGKIMDSAGKVIGVVQGDGSIK